MSEQGILLIISTVNARVGNKTETNVEKFSLGIRNKAGN